MYAEDTGQWTLFASTHARVRRWVALPLAARRMGISTPQLLDAIRGRRVPARLVGGARWFVPSSVAI